MEFEGKCSEAGRQVKEMVLQKELWKQQSFGTEELLKTANDTDGTDFEARCLTIARQTSCITLEAVIKWILNELLAIFNEPVPSKSFFSPLSSL